MTRPSKHLVISLLETNQCVACVRMFCNKLCSGLVFVHEGFLSICTPTHPQAFCQYVPIPMCPCMLCSYICTALSPCVNSSVRYSLFTGHRLWFLITCDYSSRLIVLESLLVGYTNPNEEFNEETKLYFG
jgi:hypothetical protein